MDGEYKKAPAVARRDFFQNLFTLDILSDFYVPKWRRNRRTQKFGHGATTSLSAFVRQDNNSIKEVQCSIRQYIKGEM